MLNGLAEAMQQDPNYAREMQPTWDKLCAALRSLGGLQTDRVYERAYERCYQHGSAGLPPFCLYGAVTYAQDGINPTAESWPAFEWWLGYKDSFAPVHPS